MDYPFNRRALFSLQAIVICVVGALLGLLCVWLPSYFLIIGLGTIVYIVVVWLWPEFALLGLLLLLATVFDENSLPSISIGVGHLIVSDFLLFIPIVILLLRTWVEPGVSINHTPLDFPLLAFYCVALFSTISAIVHGTVTFNQSLSEVRVVNLYLTFFIVTNLVRDEKHLRRLLNGILVLSIFVALMMILQYFLGNITQILPGRVETLFTGNTGAPGVTRILPPGQSLVLVALITIPLLLIFDKTPSKYIFRFFLLFIVAIAVILTFNRSFWVALAIALFLAVFLVSIPEKIRFVNIAIWTAVILIMILVPVLSFAGSQAQAFVDGFATRFSTLLDPNTLNEGSLQYRVVETQYALPQIAAHPLIGLGLGADYRPWDSRIDFGSLTYDKFAYIHDGHLWTILKTGLVGYLFFIIFLFLFLQRSLRYWRQIHDPFQKAIVLSFAIAVIGILPATVVDPIFAETYWTPLLGIMMGVNEVIFRLNREQNAVLSESVN
jgi:hypothetical protein